jgi:hypothetical protein
MRIAAEQLLEAITRHDLLRLGKPASSANEPIQ